MRTINTAEKLKIQNFPSLIPFSIFAFCFLNLLTGCVQKNELELAQECVGRSQIYYQHAVERYKTLISKGKDLDRLHFELGRLYFWRGEFDKAIEELKKNNLIQARKLLAISYYWLGDFTDALEIFSKNDTGDDEYLYYYGLTCEKLNLFDLALRVYKKIKQKDFLLLAESRINIIEKQVGARSIKDIDPQVYKLIQTAPNQESYPQAGALILLCDEKIEITSKDTQISSLHYIVKILNERGKEVFSEAHIEYDSTYEKVELEYARTIKPDGTVAEVGSRHIRDVSKYLNFPLYSNAHIFIISFPEIAESSCIEYKLKIYRNQLINKKDFIVSYPLKSGEPIIDAKFILDLPVSKAMHLKTLNEEYNDFKARLRPEAKIQGDRFIYAWQFKDIPQMIPEANMPASVEINPTILISSFDSWKEVYQWWQALAQDKIRVDTAIKEKVKDLVKGKGSQEDKARSIYNFCAKEIRYVAVEYGQAGYEPHLAQDIFKNKYGDCKDQAVLLVTMLKEAGLKAWPVLISTREYYNLNQDLPAVFFNHSIACVRLKDKIVFLDPTCSTCSFGDLPASDQARQVLVFKEDNYEIQNTPLYPAEHNLIKQEIHIKINSDETISAKKDIFTYGVYGQAQRYWLLYTPPQLIEEALKEKIQEVSIGAKLKDYHIKNLNDLNNPLVLSYTFSGPEYLTVASDLRIMPQLTSIDTAIVAKDRRKFPIDFGILDEKETLLDIEIPVNISIKYMPKAIIQDSPWFKIEVDYSCNKNRLLFRQRIKLKERIVQQKDYAYFKALFEDLAKKTKQRVILERIK